MRVLKFRAWNKEKKSMYWWGIPEKEGGHVTTDTFLGGDGIIMQFTGCLDQHGKEIYEWDVVRYLDYCWQVTWRENRTAFYLLSLESDLRHAYFGKPVAAECEIIGNSYEHPHLLQGTDTPTEAA